jgi:hypothetical protein
MAVLEAMVPDTRAVLILNTAKRSALPGLDDRAVAEVPALVGRAGPRPLAVGPVPAHAGALVAQIKDVERATIEAALTGSRTLAIRARSTRSCRRCRPRSRSSTATASASRAGRGVPRVGADDGPRASVGVRRALRGDRPAWRTSHDLFPHSGKKA